MAENEKTPEEKGQEAAKAVMAGAHYAIEESIKSAWWLAKWGCTIYAIYCVVACVVTFVLAALADLHLPWWAWVGLALLVGYVLNRRRE